MQEITEELLNQIQAAVYLTDTETDEILFVNEKMKEKYGNGSSVGRKCWEVLQKGKKCRCSCCKVQELMQRKEEKSIIRWQEEGFANGRIYVHYDSLITWKGRPVHMQQIYDITNRQQLKECMQKDELCGIWNRTRGKEMLEESLANLQKGGTCCVVLIDVDNLKNINEFFGHQEGDFVLQKISAYLEEQVTEPDFLFRLSGDGFAMVFHNADAGKISEDVAGWRKDIEEMGEQLEKPYKFSFAFGSCCVQNKSQYTLNEILDKADGEMYEEKLRRRKKGSAGNGQQPAAFKQQMDYASQYLYDALIQSTDDYLYVCNMKTGIFRYSPALLADFELPGEIVENPMGYWKNIVHPDDWDRFYKSNIDITENKSERHAVEFRARQRNGEYVWIKCRGQLIRNEGGEAILFAGIMQKMGKHNKIDPLTQLFNHQVFMEHIHNALEDDGIEQIGVTILDVDNFRHFNEMYSREFGDELLRTLAQTIQSLLPENTALYRLDNDKMGMLTVNGSTEYIEKMFQKIQQKIQIMKEWKADNIKVQLSAGCAVYPDDGATAEGLYQYADYAMQYAKAHGRNRLTVFTEEILKEKNRSLELIKKLRDASERDYGGFYLNYQPQVRGRTGEVIGVEALVRFRDERGNAVSPAEFIPISESQGMIYGLGLWIMHRAMRDAKDWIAEKPEFSLSVNVSALQLAEENFVTDLQSVLEEEDYPAKNLIIELTESCTMQNIDIFRDKFEQLQKMGIRVALDDFGTGYSSLEILKNAPIDLVKIDRSFVKGILHSKFDATFISFVVAICHSVDIHVCLEGVETVQETDCIKDMQLDCIQGYYFGYPVEKEYILEKLKEQKKEEKNGGNLYEKNS